TMSFAVTASSAQTVVQRRPNPDATRVTVSYMMNQPNVSPDTAEQQQVGETLRKAMYEMANKECGILSSVFGTDCKMAQMNVQVGNRAGREGLTVSGSAMYELTPK
ncbi:hypothetical protein WDZ92_46425, partial [Nostoc sp. NIES-2111]